MTQHFPRRQVLKAGGVAMALPWLESLPGASAGAKSGGAPMRMVLTCYSLSFYRDYFYPKQQPGPLKASRYTKAFDGNLLKKMTMITGLNHVGAPGGHGSESVYITGTPTPTQSLDQLVAERVGTQTRFDSLVLGNGGYTIAYTRSGTPIPPASSPSQLYEMLFIDEGSKEVEKAISRLRAERSLLDVVHGQAESLKRNLSALDQQRMEQYFEAVRQVERKLQKAEEWAKIPKPQVDAKQPNDVRDNSDIVAKTAALYDIMQLALRTDSTRVMALLSFGSGRTPPINGVSEGHHPLSHHGNAPDKIEQLAKIEGALMQTVGDFLKELDSVDEGSGTLLDHTLFYLGSNLGNASNHNGANLPVMLAGGPLKHGQYHELEPQKEPITNMYLSMLNAFGIEEESFKTSTGPLSIFS